jgi:hypothetical protein
MPFSAPPLRTEANRKQKLFHGLVLGTFRYRSKPPGARRRTLELWLAISCHLYNAALRLDAYAIARYGVCGEGITRGKRCLTGGSGGNGACGSV